ncbi:MAG: YihY/virulence factor BrkB family protein [Bacteroidota bacterium]|nr:YihY/virulence factor BrkB family protein [Bacteroidota bacterium]
MTKIERILITASPISGLRAISKKITLPGFKGLPLYDVFHALLAQINKHGLNIRAGAISFNIITAIPAITLFLCILVPYVPGSAQVYHQLLAFVKEFTPNSETQKILTRLLNEFFNKPTTGLLSIGFLLVLFTSSNAMMGIIRAFDRSVIEKRKTNFIKKRLRAIRLIITLVSLLLGTVLISVGQGYLFTKIMQWADIKNGSVIKIIQNSRWLVIFFLFVLAIGYIYKYAPTAETKSKVFTPGAVMASVLMIVITGLFSYWAKNISTYNKFYGSIGSLIIIMLLIFLNSMMLLVGYELNISISLLAGKKKEKQSKE